MNYLHKSFFDETNSKEIFKENIDWNKVAMVGTVSKIITMQ